MEHHTAGDPTKPDLLYTHVPVAQLVRQLDHLGLSVSSPVVTELLSDLGLGRRQLVKSKTYPDSPNRDQQFRRLDRYRQQFQQRGQPILSLDSKQTELLGNLFRPGTVWSTAPIPVLDHTFEWYATGHFVPHGIYDLHHHHGHLTLNQSRDTGVFATDALGSYWDTHGRSAWPDAHEVLVLCDCGGSNKVDSWVFKRGLWQFAQSTGLTVRVCHYPRYCSKYNPIERRLFSVVHRCWQGAQWTEAEQAADQARNLYSTTGLRVTAEVWDREYKRNKPMPQAERAEIPVTHDETLAEYNYVLSP